MLEMDKGDFIKVDYVGKLESGEIFDLTKEDVARKENIYNEKMRYRPIPIVLGAGFVISGLEKALLGMKVGEKKNVGIAPEEGFGDRNPDRIKVINSKVFKERNVEPKPGMIVDFSGAKGRIQSVSSGRVTVDFNNPMAGKKLLYELEIEEKVDDPKEQVKCLFDFFGLLNVEVKFSDDSVEVEAEIIQEIKNRIASLAMEYVKYDGKDLSAVKFTQTFRKEKKA